MAAFTIDIPYVGPIDVGGLTGAAQQPGMAAGAASVTGAAIGSVVPGLGTAVGATIGALIGELGGMVKGKTQTFDWNTSNAYALKFSQQLAKQTQASVPNADAQALAYQIFVATYIQSSGRWNKTRADEVAQGLLSDKYGLKDKPTYDRIWMPLWELAMWILTQSDKNRPEELPKFFSAILPDAYVKYWFPGGAVSVALPAFPGQATGSILAPSTQALGTPSGATTTLRTYLLIGGAVILIIITVVIVLRK